MFLVETSEVLFKAMFDKYSSFKATLSHFNWCFTMALISNALRRLNFTSSYLLKHQTLKTFCKIFIFWLVIRCRVIALCYKLSTLKPPLTYLESWVSPKILGNPGGNFEVSHKKCHLTTSSKLLSFYYFQLRLLHKSLSTD